MVLVASSVEGTDWPGVDGCVVTTGVSTIGAAQAAKTTMQNTATGLNNRM